MTIQELITELQEAQRLGCDHVVRVNEHLTTGGNITSVEYSENLTGKTTGCVLIIDIKKYK